MSFANAFDARLDRIRSDRGIETPQPRDTPSLRTPQAQTQPPLPDDRGPDIQVITLIALGLFFVPLGVFAALVTLDFDLKMPTLENLSLTAAETTDRPKRNLVERLLYGEAPPFLYTYLPPAPEGWIRVTPADAQDDVQAAIAALGARYPGGEVALRDHPIFQPTARFLDLANDERVTFQPLNLVVWHQAYYLHPSGSGLVAKLVVRGAEHELVSPDGPALFEAEMRRLREIHGDTPGTFEDLEGSDFAGMTEIRAGAAVLPILKDASGFQGRVDLHFAVGSNAIIELRGVADGQDLAEILAGIDANAIDARAGVQN